EIGEEADSRFNDSRLEYLRPLGLVALRDPFVEVVLRHSAIVRDEFHPFGAKRGPSGAHQTHLWRQTGPMRGPIQERSRTATSIGYRSEALVTCVVSRPHSFFVSKNGCSWSPPTEPWPPTWSSKLTCLAPSQAPK